jgi:hypothetical protein
MMQKATCEIIGGTCDIVQCMPNQLLNRTTGAGFILV